MMFHENHLPADDSHEFVIFDALFVILEKNGKILNCRLLQIIGGALIMAQIGQNIPVPL